MATPRPSLLTLILARALTSVTGQDIRLVSDSDCCGRVEIRYNGQWGSELQMPILTFTHAVVSPGENIQFRCTTPKPRCNANAEFQIFRNRLSISSQKHVSSVTFNLFNVDISHQGKYSCQYSYENKKSPLSSSVIIFVVDLQQPSISHSASDGQFVVGSQGPVITRGHSFTIICSTESQFPGGSFHLFTGSNITRSESAVNHSASFFFPEADYSHEGNYSCVYEVSVSSRSFRSSASELLLITITASLLPVIGAAVSAVLLLLSVLIIILLLKRRQKQRNKETRSKCCFTKGQAASLNSKNEEDDEVDYENVNLDENMDHNDSEQDYINVDSDHSEEDSINVDSDHSKKDYINVDSNHSKKDYINVDSDHSEEDYINVDSDHSEEDYINVDSDHSKKDYINVDSDHSEEDYINVDSDHSKKDYINVDSDHSEEDYINVDSDHSKKDYINVDSDHSEKDYINVD
ncbi:hypothetical protein QQF64_024911 [Cirrhinus molitorella]|uniref:Deleted in malignant brain tumors 1-like protein n=1 Tax=Cirrhinus molitorella TaxID=172907 RepID=A0ABR3NMN0_9TELE